MRTFAQGEEEELNRRLIRGQLVGAAVGLGGSLAAAALAKRYSATYRGLTVPGKVFLIGSGTVATSVIYAEAASMRLLKETYGDFREEKDASKLTVTQRSLQWLQQNRWRIVGTSWLGGMGVSWYMVSRNKYATGAQKIVQARMFAQGLTLLVLLLSIGLQMIPVEDSASGEDVYITDPSDQRRTIKVHYDRKERYPGEFQWKNMVAEEEARMAHDSEGKHEAQHKLKAAAGKLEKAPADA